MTTDPNLQLSSGHRPLGGKTYVPSIRGPDEAMPRDTDKMNSAYKPPEWITRT